VCIACQVRLKAGAYAISISVILSNYFISWLGKGDVKMGAGGERREEERRIYVYVIVL
jgi:hypothetical protein